MEDTRQDTQLGRRRKSAGKNDYLHFRVGPETTKRLDAIVEDLASKGVATSRSAVARSLLHQQLGRDGVEAEIEESLTTVWHIVHKAMGRLIQDANQRLPSYLREGVTDFYEQRVGRAPKS